MPSLAAEKKKQRKVSGLINSTCSLFKRSLLMCPWVNDHCKEMVSRRGNGHVFFSKSKTRAECELHACVVQAWSSHFHRPLFSHHPLHSVLGAASGSETGFESDMREHFGFFKTQIQTNALPKHFLLHILCNISSSVTGWNVDHCFLSKSWFVFSFEHYGVLIWLIVA